MTSHHQPSNVVKFPPIGECDPSDAEPNVISIFNAKPLPCDYADTRVRTERMLEALADDSVERDTERRRLAAVEADTLRDIRVMRWQVRIKWGCIVLAYATIIYFCWQLGRGQ